jgi:phage terminase large subunit
LEWRRWCIKNNCQNDVEQFQQEYPSNPDEAFISTGSCIFDKESVINRLRYVPKPIKQGYFVYNEEKARHNIMSDIKWVNDKKGYIKIFKPPNTPAFTQYCVGGDTAGDTQGDEFSSDVVDAKTLEQVATLTMQTDEDLYAKQMYCLGKYYGWALMAIETNYSTYPQKKLEELGYPKFYVREVVDRFDKSVTKQFGFNTNKKTKPLMLANLVELVREYTDVFNDEKTLRQMLTFVKKDGGEQEAEEGYHDDKVMSIAIAHQARGQVVFPVDVMEMHSHYNFNIEREIERQYDYGEEIIPI